jgi:hypothetical protein
LEPLERTLEALPLERQRVEILVLEQQLDPCSGALQQQIRAAPPMKPLYPESGQKLQV